MTYGKRNKTQIAVFISAFGKIIRSGASDLNFSANGRPQTALRDRCQPQHNGKRFEHAESGGIAD